MSERASVEARAQAAYSMLEGHLRPESDRTVVAELRAAGVSRARIRAVYPGEILDLAPHLEVTMRKRPVPPEATQMDEALVELSVRNWTFMTLSPEHAQQIVNVAFPAHPVREGYIDFGKGRRAAVVASMDLRLLLALIELLAEDAFKDAGAELPWAEIAAFLNESDAALRLVDKVLTKHPTA